MTKVTTYATNLVSYDKSGWICDRSSLKHRVCQCDNLSVQDENHVMFICPKTLEVIDSFKAVVGYLVVKTCLMGTSEQSAQ